MAVKYDKPCPAILLTDFYKICHKGFYHPKTQQLVSYWTPRKSRLEGINYVVMFGLQAYIKKYLMDYFSENFFERPFEEIREEYVTLVGQSMDEAIAKSEIQAFAQLHQLGYLPLEINALAEGTIAPIGCPMIEFKVTDSRFFWLVNYLETLSSCNIWYPMTTATIAYASRRIIDKWYDKTVDEGVSRTMAAGDFSMRGMTSVESAPMADAGHLLSFASTATVPTLWWLKNFYNAPFTVARGTPSTEHSVMESYTPAHELAAYRHLIEDVRPSGNLSIVSDTWDLWRVVTEYLPTLKSSILKREGKIIIRPDSGNPPDILCGTMAKNGKTPEEKGLIELLWDIFGGTINGKGYKVLDSHIGAIYGDAITHKSCEEICQRLADKGFATCNLVFGYGSYTYQYLTRDSLGFALKVTSGVIDGQEVQLFKDPITDSGVNSAAKKSQKGLCIVKQDPQGGISYTDEHTSQEVKQAKQNLLRPVFRDGCLLVDEDFEVIRHRLHKHF